MSMTKKHREEIRQRSLTAMNDEGRAYIAEVERVTRMEFQRRRGFYLEFRQKGNIEVSIDVNSALEAAPNATF